MKLFTDDFESTIRQGGKQNFLLTESADDEIFSNYLKQRFALKIGQKEVDWDFIGFELRDDAVLCYMLVKKIKPFNEIQIENRVFTEIFTDQINLTHFEYSDKIKSIKTEAKHPSGTITVLD